MIKTLQLKSLLESGRGSTRALARSLKEKILANTDGEDLVALSFSEMSVISRAFLHELLEIREEFQRGNLALQFVDVQGDLNPVISLIESQRAERKQLEETGVFEAEIPVVSLEDFLAA